MPRASKKTQATEPSVELQLEEGVRPGAIAGLVSDEAPGQMATLQSNASNLASKTQEIENAIATATNMMGQLVGAAQTDLGNIQTEVLALASGTMTTDQLKEKYGELTHAESASKLATLERVANSIGVKIEEVKVQTKALVLEETKLLKTKQTFKVIGTVAEVIDAADEAAYKHHKVGINHVARQDDLDYTEGKRVKTAERNADNLTYRGEQNRLAKENEANIIAHETSVNGILEQARAVTRSILQAKVDKRKFTADAMQKSNNSAPTGGQSA